jgi:hypothetical protein
MNKPKLKPVTGYILYRGASLLDGKPIVVVAITSTIATTIGSTTTPFGS